MSSNTAIRLTEQPDGTWEVLRYDVDIEKYRKTFRGSVNNGPTIHSSLDLALDKAQSMYSEYGLEIVRLKDTTRDELFYCASSQCCTGHPR